MAKSFLVLGSGYTGRFIKDLVTAAGAHVLETHRASRSPSDFEFDLNKQETWHLLPSVDGTFWTFPPSPPDLVRKFLAAHVNKLGRIVVIGTTGSYLVDQPDQEVSEDSLADQNDLRVQGEAEILKSGGLVVRAAGIYGPDRDPRRWIQEGRVGASSKFVNFIHVEDLAQILWKAMMSNFCSKVYIAADGHPYRWFELTSVPDPGRSQRVSKRVNSRRTLEELQIQLKYPNVLEGMAALQ